RPAGVHRDRADTAEALRLAPAVPAVDRDGDEHDLAAGLTQHVGAGGVAEPRAHEDREEHDVAHDAHGPRPYLAAQTAQCGREPEQVADDLAPVDLLVGD